MPATTVVAIMTIETDPQSPFGAPEVPAAEWTFRHCRDKAFQRGPEFVRAWLTQAAVDRVPEFPAGQSLEHVRAAYVNHGRWLWDCALCSAAQVCSATDPRAFCAMCFNRGDGWWPVEFPAEKATIELLLGRRPRLEQRNWSPGEDIVALQLENLQIGVDPDVADYPFPGAERALELVRSHRAAIAGARAPELEAPPKVKPATRKRAR